MKRLYYIHTDRGCAIRAAEDEDAAYDAMCREIGENNVEDIRLATVNDIAWVQGMGGHIPEGRYNFPQT